MNALLDTTILANYCLAPTPIDRESIRAFLRKFTEVLLFRYAIKEFEAGPLRAFVLTHQCLIRERSLERVFDWIQKLLGTPRRNLPSTALKAISVAYRKAAPGLRDEYFSDANMRKLMRVHLKRHILDAWEARLTIGTRIIPDLPCYPEFGPVSEGKNLRLPQPRCYASQPCALALHLASEQADITHLLIAVRSMPRTNEVDRWDRSLTRILQGPIGDRDCREVGDPFFSLFSPPDCVIITTNIKHHRPLANALGKMADGLG